MDAQVLTDALAALLWAEDALAAAANPVSPKAAGSFWLAIAIVYLTRKRKIGGWLALFYVELYVESVFSVVLSIPTVKQLSPEGWDSQRRYVMFLASTLPLLVAAVCECVLGTLLLYQRSRRNVHRIQLALVAMLATNLLSVAIDVLYFPGQDSSVALGVRTTILSGIWCWYFFVSKRVKSVFIDHVWDYDALHPKPPKTPPAVMLHLFKRGVLVAGIGFVVFVVGKGIANADAKPDVDLFALPFLWAMFVGIGSWAFPMRKKTRDALAAQPQ